MSFFTAFRRRPALAEYPDTEGATAVAAVARLAPLPGPRMHRSRRRRAVTGAVTALAFLLVGAALLLPETYRDLHPGAFARVPAEGLLGVALLMALPSRARRICATVAGAALGLLTLLKLLFLGFSSVVGRPFDLVLDWTFFGNGMDYVRASAGRVAGIGVAIGAALLVGALVLLGTWSVRRVSQAVVRRPTATVGFLTVLGVGWVVGSLLGLQVVPGEPLAAKTTVHFVDDAVSGVRSSLNDREVFRQQTASDRYRATPGDRLLTGLRGKDVVFAFVESYGRSAVEDPQIAPGVDAVLDAANNRLTAAGFRSASGWLTSPTVGGGSWLAHSTLLSGTKVANQQRYRTLVTSSRFTLTRAFARASWRTVALMPATHGAWPEGSFYGYQRLYVSSDLGYRGPGFSWAPMPDQFALAALQHKELGVPGHKPVMVEAELISSHAPWAPLPRMVPWRDLGDGSVFDPMPAQGKRPDQVWPNPSRVRTEYGHSIEYSLSALTSFVETYGTKDTVVVFLGDHQAAPIVTGGAASRDVPITIVAKDPAVLRQVSGWGWQPGLKPGHDAPVWPMDAFRDRFISAFSPAAR